MLSKLVDRCTSVNFFVFLHRYFTLLCNFFEFFIFCRETFLDRDNVSSLFCRHTLLLSDNFTRIFLDTRVDTTISEYFFKFSRIISQNCTRNPLKIPRPHQITQWSYFLLTKQCREPSRSASDSTNEQLSC